MKILIILMGIAVSPAFGWWCEGHEVVALIAEKHLNPAALANVNGLLKQYPVDAPHFCKDSPTDPMVYASTWADDVKNSEHTAFWHYMDIPLDQKKGDPETWCEPVGPSKNGGQRPGCVLSALRSSIDIIHSKDETDSEKANALRYLIHFMGDLHQPLHTTSNNDRGGNCTPVRFFDQPALSNLHSVWDGLIFDRDAAARHEDVAQFAADLDQRFSSHSADWIKNAPQFDKWVWESHKIAQNVTYGHLTPEPPIEKLDPKADCKVQMDKFGALHLQIGDEYENQAVPVMEEQLAKAGYRLAAVLNLLFGS